jgi:F-type H+-transporting ATPase subunit delta
MSQHRIVTDLAQALVSAAHDERVVPRVVSELKAVHEAMAAHSTLLADLSERAIPLERRMQVLAMALDPHLHPFVTNALRMLMQHGLLPDLSAFTSAAIAEAETRADHHDVHVTSAVALSKTEQEHLAEIIRKKFGGTHTLSQRIDPSILGGLILDVGDWHLDASLTGKLTRLTNALTA